MRVTATEIGARYIAALQAADAGDCRPLLEFLEDPWNVDFPGWMVDSLDRQARRMGVTRQSLIKLWLGDKLGEKTAANNRRG